ncbi:Detected protein of confused Function [Hibiscus syriacus]|uniref:Detected protein of confused Function n=1 Tax=Hibiscus syriacus TaxID=106335 RepID=A0A6A3BUN6_HIBSY|nr:Detected protein of confused Function [Hibiscus syriacus]
MLLSKMPLLQWNLKNRKSLRVVEISEGTEVIYSTASSASISQYYCAEDNGKFQNRESACHHFSSDRCTSEGLSSVMYKASFGEETLISKKFEATVTRLHPSTQGLRDFINEVNTCIIATSKSLRALYGRSDGPPLDWNTRMKIALCSAQGLTFLHEEGPFQAMYNEFSTANIQIDKDFSAKLSGWLCRSYPGDRTDLQLSLIMDPQLKGRFPMKAARTDKFLAITAFGARMSFSPTGPPNLPLTLPPRACSSTMSLEELERQGSQRSHRQPLEGLVWKD